MPYTYYHTGIIRGSNNKNIFKNVSDSTQVQLEVWDNGRPYNDGGRNFVLWYFVNDSKKILCSTGMIIHITLFVNTKSNFYS